MRKPVMNKFFTNKLFINKLFINRLFINRLFINKPRINKFCRGCLLCTGLIVGEAYGEIDRVYHPYVEQQERELEYGITRRDLGDDGIWLQRIGVGYAWTDNFFSEVYVLSESLTHDDDKIRQYEVELKWQLTEQGEYWADWGLLMEAASATNIGRHEFAAGIIAEKELTGRLILTVNGILEYEFGSEQDNEWESAFRAQLRYRNTPGFEPAVEIYLDDQDWAAGPAWMGIYPLSAGRQIQWELGVVFGLNSQTPDTSLRAGLELEF